MTADDIDDIACALAEPFGADDVSWKPQSTSKDGTRCMAVAYIDARDVMDRLDAVCGVAGWFDRYEPAASGCVLCSLSILIGGEWVTKCDVGGPSQQPDEADRVKAAYSDALKRAAVHWGIGRYLYRLTPQWVDYDPVKKRMLGVPQLPPEALPRRRQSAPATTAQQPPRPGLPADGKELLARAARAETRLVEDGRCARGELVAALVAAGREEGFPEDVSLWVREQAEAAVPFVSDFVNARLKGGAA